MEIYHLVVSVDKHQDGHFACSDVICDFLYPFFMATRWECLSWNVLAKHLTDMRVEESCL